MSTLAPQRQILQAGSALVWRAGGLILVAMGLVCVALLGPLTGGPVEYHVSDTLRNQTIGLDAFSLFVVAPLSLLAAGLVVRGQVGGHLLTLAIGTYTSYMFAQYILGPEYLGRPGNNELLFPLYLVLFSLGWILAVAAWRAVDPADVPRPPRRRELLIARYVLPALAFLTFSRYIPALADAMSSAPEEPGYTAGPTFFWVIATMDLGIFLPLTIATCSGLIDARPWAPKALYAVAGWFGLVGPAVAAMAVAMSVNDDPSATGAATVSMSALGLAFAALAVVVYRPLIPAPRTATFVLGSDSLEITLAPGAAIASLRRRLRIPYASIADVDAGVAHLPSTLALRLGSAFLLTDRRYGLLRHRGAWGLYAVADRERALTLRLRPPSTGRRAIRTVVIGTDDAPQLAEAIRLHAASSWNARGQSGPSPVSGNDPETASP